MSLKRFKTRFQAPYIGHVLQHAEQQGAVQADCVIGVGSKREGRGVGWWEGAGGDGVEKGDIRDRW